MFRSGPKGTEVEARVICQSGVACSVERFCSDIILSESLFVKIVEGSCFIY